VVYQYSTPLPNAAGIIISLHVYNSTTSISFAGQTATVSPQELKTTITVTNWPFAKLQNHLEVLLDAAATGQDVANQCNSVSAQEDNTAVLRWFQFAVGNAFLYAQFLPYGLADNATRALNITYSDPTSADTDSVVVTIRSSVFFNSLVIDPNYMVLLDPFGQGGNHANKDNGLCGEFEKSGPDNSVTDKEIIGIVVGVVGAALLAGFILMILAKKKQRRSMKKLTSKFNQVASAD